MIGFGQPTVCSQSNTFTTTSAMYSRINIYSSAADLVVNSGEDFELTQVESRIWTEGAGTGPPTAPITNITLNYYIDSNGLPGTLIGTEIVSPTTHTYLYTTSNGGHVYDLTLDVTPITFQGSFSGPTTYWIGLASAIHTGGGQVYWLHHWSGAGNNAVNNYSTQVGGVWGGITGDFHYTFNGNCISYSGCTDSLALNYNPSAIYDDGSCCYNCGKIEGFIYEDADSSGTYDSIFEIPVSNQIMQLEKSNGELSYVTTQSDGYYSFFVAAGQQVINYSPPTFWESSNNNNQYNIDIQTDSTYSGFDFGIMPEFTKGDMNVDITTSNTVCNNPVNIWLTVRNVGTETINNVNVDLWVNNTSLIQSASGGGVITGNHVSWSLPGNFFPFIYTGEEQTFSVYVQLPGSGQMGQQIIDSARVTPVQVNLIELDYTNNFAQTSNTLLCAYDPNDKRVIPEKCFYNTQDTLDYTIRFQNTGNYPATTVRLVDSLDLEKLDILSFQVLGASHDYEWSLKVPSVLEVVFDNIMLVDSSVSFNESQGFFKYRIIVKDSLPDLQPTASPAFIYFDLNPAVVTNLPEVNFIDPAIPDISYQTSCDTYTWPVNGQTYSASGTYTDSSINTIGCIYTEILNLTINSSTSNTSNQTSCDSYTWPVNGQTYSASGTYTDISTNASGCMHTDTLDLLVNLTTSSVTNQTACDSYTWNGNMYSLSGNYLYNTLNVNGCDSIASLDLTVNYSYITIGNISICQGDSVVIGGISYYTSGSYNDVYTSANGCDSTITTNLTVYPAFSVAISQIGMDLVVNVLGGTSPYDYFWSTGETTPQITPSVNGQYWVVVSDQDNCYSDTVYYMVDWTSTIVEEVGIGNLRIYPNPSKDIFNIRFTSEEVQDLQVRILNVIGKEVSTENLQKFEGEYIRTFYLNQYPKGIYLLEIETDYGVINKKLILQ